MKKLLTVFVVLALVVCVVAVFAPAVRAGPVIGPNEEVFLASATPIANFAGFDKVEIVALSPGFGLGLSAYATSYDHAHTFMRPVKEWVRVLSTGVRTSKWPGTLVALVQSLNNPLPVSRKFSVS